MRYVSIDLETTGLDSESCQILEIGAVADDLEGDTHPMPFHCFVVHEQVVGELGGIAMNGEILRIIADRTKHADDFRFLRPDQVVHFFREWLRWVGLDPDEVLNVAGKNFARFDQKFLDRLPGWKRGVRIKSRVLDPAILYARPEDPCLPSLGECLERAGLPAHVSHRATDDAMAVVGLLRRHFLGSAEEESGS